MQGVASNGGAVSFLVRDGTGSVVRALAADGSSAGRIHQGYQGQYTNPNTGLLTWYGARPYDLTAAQNTVTETT